MPANPKRVMDAVERYVDLEEKFNQLQGDYATLDEEYSELESLVRRNQIKLQSLNRVEAEYGALLEQLKWTHAMLSILIEEQGGLVEVSRAVLEGYELDGSIKVFEDPERDVYIIAVSQEDEDEQ